MARGSWARSATRRILREREVLPDDARQLRERGQREFDRLDAEMRDARARTRPATRTTCAVLRENDADHPPTEEAMLEAYTEWTERARAVPRRHRPRDAPRRRDVCRRPVAGVPAARARRRVVHRAAGVLRLAARATSSSRSRPTAPPEEEIQERLVEQLLRLASRRPPSTRRTRATTGTSSGARRPRRRACARSTGRPTSTRAGRCTPSASCASGASSTDPLHELQHLSATIFRAARIIVDTSLHLGEMTFDEAVAFMSDKAALPEPVAIAEVGRYCWWPTQASSYLTGCLEILDIRRPLPRCARVRGRRAGRRPGRGDPRLPRHDRERGLAAPRPGRSRGDGLARLTSSRTIER